MSEAKKLSYRDKLTKFVDGRVVAGNSDLYDRLAAMVMQEVRRIELEQQGIIDALRMRVATLETEICIQRRKLGNP